jgi:hypothetical protein
MNALKIYFLCIYGVVACLPPSLRAQPGANSLVFGINQFFMGNGDYRSIGFSAGYERTFKNRWVAHITGETLQAGREYRPLTTDRTRTLILNSQASDSTLNFPSTYIGNDPYSGLAVLDENTTKAIYNAIKVGIGYKMIRRPHHLFSLYAAATLVDMQRTFIVHQATGTYTGPFGGTAPINLAVPFYSRILGIGVTPTLDYRYVFNDKLFVGVYVEGDFYINPVLWGSRKHGLKIGVQF